MSYGTTDLAKTIDVKNNVITLYSTINTGYQDMLELVQTLWTSVWEPASTNPNVIITPSDIVNELGTYALSMFLQYQGLVTYLESVQPGVLPTKYQSTPLSYTVVLGEDNNPTGQITIP